MCKIPSTTVGIPDTRHCASLQPCQVASCSPPYPSRTPNRSAQQASVSKLEPSDVEALVPALSSVGRYDRELFSQFADIVKVGAGEAGGPQCLAPALARRDAGWGGGGGDSLTAGGMGQATVPCTCIGKAGWGGGGGVQVALMSSAVCAHMCVCQWFGGCSSCAKLVCINRFTHVEMQAYSAL